MQVRGTAGEHQVDGASVARRPGLRRLGPVLRHVGRRRTASIPLTDRPSSPAGGSDTARQRVQPMNRAALDELQMHGQDIPWLLATLGHPQARPPGPGLGSSRGRRPAMDLRRTPRRHAWPGRGAARPRPEGGRQGAHPRREFPEMLAGLAGLRHARRGGGHHQHPLGGGGNRLLRRPCRLRRCRHRCRTTPTPWPRPRPTLKWIAVIPGDDGDPTDAATPGGDRSGYRSPRSPGTPARGPARPIEPMLPFGIMFTSGTTSRPKAVVHTHANAIWASRTGPRNIDLGTDDRYLIYLPFFHVNAQSWSFFSVLGVGATAVLMPKWSVEPVLGRGQSARDHPHLADALLHRHHRRPRPPRHDHAAHRGVRADHGGARLRCSALPSTPPTG